MGILRLVATGIANLFRLLGTAFHALWTKSKPLASAVLVVLVLGMGLGADSLMHLNRAFAGVSIGGIDVSGMTEAEITEALEASYGQKVRNGQVVIYASEDSQQHAHDALNNTQDAALAEQISVEEAQKNKQAWQVTAESLGAELSSQSLADSALALGRSEGGILARAQARFAGTDIPLTLNFDENSLEALASDIDATIGTPRVEYGVTIENGQAKVTEGNDGDIVDRNELRQRFTSAFTEGEGNTGSFVAKTGYAPVRIDAHAAQETCDAVNAAIANGAVFTCGNSSWEASRKELGSWIDINPVEKKENWQLLPQIDASRAAPTILQGISADESNSEASVAFSIAEDGSVRVAVSGVESVPLITQAVGALNELLFGCSLDTSISPEEAASVAQVEDGLPATVAVPVAAPPREMSLDEACTYGIVMAISSYTTEYTTGAGTENRNHNIHLAADLIDSSIVKGGKSWSFQQEAGECDEAHGFLAAGAILNDEYTDAIGGGVCQVATTVFNAVYEAGYPIPTRHNHSLYIASYPAGRDAAVSWPDLDLVWENDTNSDILLRAEHTDSTISVTLYGVDPGYTVSTEEGSWEEGERYTTTVSINEDLGKDDVYLKTSGSDGSTYWITRTVTNRQGEILHVDRFDSVYQPKDEVYEAGSQEAANAVLKKAAQEDEERS